MHNGSTNWSVLAIVAGPVLYLALDAARVLPVALRDAPWPLELSAALCAVAAIASAARCRRRASWAAAVVACAAVAALSVHARGVELLPSSDLPTGGALPQVVLQDEDGAPFELASLRGAPALLVFFRGATCPFCRAQLLRLDAEAPRFVAAGVRVVAISPDAGAPLRRLRGELGLSVQLLADEDERAVARLCGGKAHCEVLTDAGGVVRWAGFSESWSDVPAPALLLQAAYRLR